MVGVRRYKLFLRSRYGYACGDHEKSAIRSGHGTARDGRLEDRSRILLVRRQSLRERSSVELKQMIVEIVEVERDSFSIDSRSGLLDLHTYACRFARATLTRHNEEIAYQRDNFYYVHREHIIRRALDLKNSRRSNVHRSAAPADKRSNSPVLRADGRARRKVVPDPRRVRRHDVFLSHASEDKKAIARPLYRVLNRKGITVWFDEGTLTIGDSLREKIDEGSPGVGLQSYF